MSLTPCIYPLIPITVGFIGANSSGSRTKGFSLSLVYVTGMALVYSGLGLFASLTGTIFGEISSHPVTDFIVGSIVFMFGLSMLDIFTLHMPQFIKLPQVTQGGYFPAFLLGVSSGFVVGPCLTPVLGSILLYLAKKQNILYGTTLLFTFACGMGLILVLIGTFSGLLTALPKSGKWLVYIKRVCALILIGAGLFFIFLAVRRF